MKHLLLSCAALLTMAPAGAQLPDGSTAPDFTVTAFQPALAAAGTNGNGTYNLYDYLDAGYTVYVDISATWCWPCWEFHSSGIFEELYREHGPLLPGHPGVDPNSTNDVMVFWLDLDPATEDADVLDGAGSIGNWTDPAGNGEIRYPVANPDWTPAYLLNEAYNINTYPTIYRICPNRTTTLARFDSADEYYALAGSCAVASGAVNPSVLDGSCAMDGSWIALQNMGTQPLTSATLELRQGNAVVSTLNWTGNLATYEKEEIYAGAVTNGVYSVGITSQDDVPEGNANAVGLRPVWMTESVTVELTTDAYGEETHWCLREHIATNIGDFLYLAGPFNTVAAPGTTVQAPITVDLDPNTCYLFAVLDEFGDGIDSGFGEGSFRLKDADGNILFEGGDFEDEVYYYFRTGGLLGVAEENGISGLNVWPNPASDELNVAFSALQSDYTVSLIDLQGRTLLAQRHPGLSGGQTIVLPLTGIAAGNYLVRLASEGISTVRSVVVK